MDIEPKVAPSNETTEARTWFEARVAELKAQAAELPESRRDALAQMLREGSAE